MIMFISNKCTGICMCIHCNVSSTCYHNSSSSDAAVKEVCKDLFCSSIIMGQLFSSEEEVSRVKEAVGSLLYHTMLEGGAVPTLDVVHPRLLTDHEERSDSSVRLQEQLQQVDRMKKCEMVLS